MPGSVRRPWRGCSCSTTGAAAPQVRVGDQGGAVGHHARGHAMGLKRLHDLARTPPPGPLRHPFIQGRGVGQPSVHRGEPLVPQRGRILHRFAQPLPLGIVSHRDHTPRVVAAAGVTAVGCAPAAAVSQRPGSASIDQPVQQRRPDERCRDLALGDVDELPLPRGGPVMQRRHQHEGHVNGDDVVGGRRSATPRARRRRDDSTNGSCRKTASGWAPRSRSPSGGRWCPAPEAGS